MLETFTRARLVATARRNRIAAAMRGETGEVNIVYLMVGIGIVLIGAGAAFFLYNTFWKEVETQGAGATKALEGAKGWTQ